MWHRINSVLDWLNRYATLLLVIVTCVYVWFTGKTLKTMERANLREPRARHLEDIKQSVATPIAEWIDEQVAKMLNGRQDTIVLKDETAGKRPSRFDMAVPGPQLLNVPLLSDARTNHFQKELKRFEPFGVLLRDLLSSLVEFAIQARQEVEKDGSLPPHDGSRDPQRFVDCSLTIRCYLRELIGGEASALELRGNPASVLESPYSGGLRLAAAPYANLNAWLAKFKEVVNGLWHKSGLREGIVKTQSEAEILRADLEKIRLTQALPGDCEYINQMGPTFLSKLKNRIFKNRAA